jgi:ribosome maturation factor RimP
LDGRPVTVNDCGQVSRTIEARLDRDQLIAPNYVLQVSSPGDRRLQTPAEWRRFVGRRVSIQPLEQRSGGPPRIEGTLIEITGDAGQETAAVAVERDGVERIPLSAVKEARLAFHW